MTEHEPAGLRLCVLGRFDLRCGNQRLIDRSWPRTKAKALLKLLALQFGASMHRDQVLEVLWPEVPLSAAANNLHKNLHYLRSATNTGHDDAIVAVHEGMVTLRPDVWIDAHQFVNRCLAARDARSDEGLTQALAIYRGELLPDDPYEAWAEPHRENLRALFVSGSLELSGLLEERGDLRAAIERTAAALQADPTVEEAHRMAMRQYARAGNSARALQQFELCRAVLKRELDIEPHERTRRMRDRILADAAGNTPTSELPPTATEDARGMDPAGEATHASPRATPPAVHFATAADGARVAYWTIGTGPGVPLVSMPVLPHTDIEREWEIPEWRAWWERIAQGRKLVRYDCRAVGASRPGATDFSIDATIAELEAVRQECGLDRIAIWAAHHSGPAAITYAARYPDRVSHLVLWCSYATAANLQGREELASLRRLLTADWNVYAESAAQFFFAWEHQRLARQYAQLILDAGDQDCARTFVRTAARYDASELLAQVRAPTLVMHRRDMPWLDPRFARELAAGISGARLAIIDGKTSAPFVGGAGGVLQMLNEFLDAPAAGSLFAGGS